LIKVVEPLVNGGLTNTDVKKKRELLQILQIVLQILKGESQFIHSSLLLKLFLEDHFQADEPFVRIQWHWGVSERSKGKINMRERIFQNQTWTNIDDLVGLVSIEYTLVDDNFNNQDWFIEIFVLTLLINSSVLISFNRPKSIIYWRTDESHLPEKETLQIQKIPKGLSFLHSLRSFKMKNLKGKIFSSVLLLHFFYFSESFAKQNEKKNMTNSRTGKICKTKKKRVPYNFLMSSFFSFSVSPFQVVR